MTDNSAQRTWRLIIAAALLCAASLVIFSPRATQADGEPVPTLTPTPTLPPVHDSQHYYVPIVARQMPPCGTAPALISPPNGQVLDTLIPLFQWNGSSDPAAQELRMQVATDPNFVQLYSTLYTSPQGAGDYRFFQNLAPATTYYWRAFLRCGGSTQQSLYSEARSFTTGSGGNIPSAPSLLSPADGASLSSSSQATLQWAAVSGAVEYAEFNSKAGSHSNYVSTTDLTEYNLTGLSPITNYEWWVLARNTYAWSSESVHRSYTTAANGAIQP